ncbi:MAG: hypothetical protein JSS68_14300 [Actinobacteria bacterium]|nr:hypothetical protein [Actinomycetota bacterium]MBS1884282.1 hypothetical protein [Actinomycetota bacterium]
MRAATVIVGAIAAASILVALAFILSPGGSGAGPTTTIERVVEAPEEPAKSEGGAQGVARGGGAQYGGPRQCGGGDYTVEGTSCAIGAQIHDDYEGGHRGDLFAKDNETGATLTFFCKDETEPITCTDEEGGVVYFGG